MTFSREADQDGRGLELHVAWKSCVAVHVELKVHYVYMIWKSQCSVYIYILHSFTTFLEKGLY